MLHGIVEMYKVTTLTTPHFENGISLQGVYLKFLVGYFPGIHI